MPAIDAGTVRVAGLRADNLAGPARAATLRPMPKLELTAKRTQRLGGLAIAVGCGGQDCRVSASGTVKVNGVRTRFKLRPASAKVAAEAHKSLRLKPTRAARRKITYLIMRGRRAGATVGGGPAGAAGRATERVRVRLTR